MNNDIKSSRQLLLLKEQYSVDNNDPIFLFLQGFSNLQDKMAENIGGVNEIEKIIHSESQGLLESTRILDTLRDNLGALSDKINDQTNQLPTFIMDEIRGEISYIREEILKFEPETKSMMKDIRKSHTKYSEKMDELFFNADYFTTTMKKRSQNLNSGLVYFLLVSVVLLQIVSLVV